MLKDCLKVFRHLLDTKGTSIVEDSHIPADGTYLLVHLERPEEPEIVEMKYDKKNDKFECEGSSIFGKIRKMDYYSTLLEMNKPIDDKKVIHSNNYLSFSLKKENLLPGGKLDSERINSYYEVLMNPHRKYEKKPKADALYTKVEEELGMPDKSKAEQCKKWIEKHVFELEQWDVDLSKKEYIKIFFDAPMEDYQRECKRYQIPNIYNSDKNIRETNGIIYGVPNNNMGLNSKKPYLEHKTRPEPAPYLIDSEEVFLQNQFFEYLYGFSSMGRYNVFVDLDEMKIEAFSKMPSRDINGIYLRIRKGKNEAEIVECENNACYRTKLPRNFAYTNFLEVDLLNLKQDVPNYDGRILKTSELAAIIDSVLFSKYLSSNYFTDAGDIKIKRTGLKQSLLYARNSLFRWLYLGDERTVKKVLDQATMIIIKGNIEEGFILKAIHQFNLRCSLQQYFSKEGETGMGERIKNIKENLRQKVNSKETLYMDNDEEYYFAVGQLVSYFISLNKSKKKMHSLANPFLNAKSNEIIKQKLMQFFKKYNYMIESSSLRFNNLYEMIVSFETSGKVNQDMILAGYLSSSLLYEKKEENK